MTNKKITGSKILKETRRGGHRGMRRRNESTAAESVLSEVGRCKKKSRAFTNPESVDVTSPGENAPPPLNFPHPTQYCAPEAKNFHPSRSPDSSTSNTRETLVEETGPIDFATKEALAEDASIVIGFIDEDEMFNMPGLVDSMAEGMLLTPPAMKSGFKWSHDTDGQVDDAIFIDLWGE